MALTRSPMKCCKCQFQCRQSTSYFCSTLFYRMAHIPCEKKLAFLQLLHSSEAAEKLRKSQRYWHLQKSRLLRRAAEKPAFTKLLRNSVEKLQKSQLSYNFYAELCKNSHDEQKLRKRSNYAGANTAGFCEAFACSFYADMHKSCVSTAFTQTCVKAAFLQLLRRSALNILMVTKAFCNISLGD